MKSSFDAINMTVYQCQFGFTAIKLVELPDMANGFFGLHW